MKWYHQSNVEEALREINHVLTISDNKWITHSIADRMIAFTDGDKRIYLYLPVDLDSKLLPYFCLERRFAGESELDTALLNRDPEMAISLTTRERLTDFVAVVKTLFADKSWVGWYYVGIIDFLQRNVKRMESSIELDLFEYLPNHKEVDQILSFWVKKRGYYPLKLELQPAKFDFN